MLATAVNATTKSKLCNLKIGIKDTRNTATALGTNTSMTTLNFGHNNIDDDGALSLANILMKTIL